MYLTTQSWAALSRSRSLLTGQKLVLKSVGVIFPKWASFFGLLALWIQDPWPKAVDYLAILNTTIAGYISSLCNELSKAGGQKEE